MTHTETRQQRRTREREERRADEAPGTQTLEYKRSVLQGLINTQPLYTRALSSAETDRIENIRGGMGYALGQVVEHAQHMELDIKIAAIREEIDILKNGLTPQNAGKNYGKEQENDQKDTKTE